MPATEVSSKASAEILVRQLPSFMNEVLADNYHYHLRVFDETTFNEDLHLHDSTLAIRPSILKSHNLYPDLPEGKYIFSNPQNTSLGDFF